MARFLPALVACVLLLSAPMPGTAHQFAPALLHLQETSPNHFQVLWKQPAIRVMGSELRPVLPAACKGIGNPRAAREGTGMVVRWEILCRNGLVGQSLGIDGLASSRADALLGVGLLNGRSYQRVLTPEEPSFRVPEVEGSLGVMRGYVGLGVKHILTGWDHLLFVAGLVLLVGWCSNLAWTVTAFTLGHSVTVALAALGVVHLPQAPIEALIALTIFFLAVELTRRRPDRPTLLQRYPWPLSAGFGLIHGLGLAGALAETGLPSDNIPLALFSFNVGIEIGQFTFIGALLAAGFALSRLSRFERIRAAQLPAVAIGGMAIFWFCERTAGLLLAAS